MGRQGIWGSSSSVQSSRALFLLLLLGLCGSPDLLLTSTGEAVHQPPLDCYELSLHTQPSSSAFSIPLYAQQQDNHSKNKSDRVIVRLKTLSYFLSHEVQTTYLGLECLALWSSLLCSLFLKSHHNSLFSPPFSECISRKTSLIHAVLPSRNPFHPFSCILSRKASLIPF